MHFLEESVVWVFKKVEEKGRTIYSLSQEESRVWFVLVVLWVFRGVDAPKFFDFF